MQIQLDLRDVIRSDEGAARLERRHIFQERPYKVESGRPKVGTPQEELRRMNATPTGRTGAGDQERVTWSSKEKKQKLHEKSDA